MITSVDAGISRLRSYLRRLSIRRKDGVVTADDAHKFLTREGVTDPNERLRITNSVLNAHNDEFTSGATRPSARPQMKGYRISEWTFVGD